MSPFKQVLLGTFLTLAPVVAVVVAVLGWWRLLPTSSEFIAILFALLLLYLYVRAGLVFAASRLTAAHSKEHDTPDGVVSEHDLRKLQDYCTDPHSSIHAAQIRYFILSVISPATLRRRVVDEFTSQQRTVKRSVSVELDIDGKFLPGEMTRSLVGVGVTASDAAEQGGHVADPNVSTGSDDAVLYIALVLPKKGVLCDEFNIVDDQGAAVSSLSHNEYRGLAAKALRALLLSAYGEATGGSLTPAAELAEQKALQDIVKFGPQSPTKKESDALLPWPENHPLTDGMRAILELWNLPDPVRDLEFLKYAANLVKILAERYAIVVVLSPAEKHKSRFFVRYGRTEIPRLDQQNWSLKTSLRHFLGSRPVGLTVNAELALTCHSYHLYVYGSEELYLADFEVPSIAKDQLGSDDAVSLEPYWHVRSRRGQSFFHIYTRGLTEIKDHLDIKVKFFEVPPGSVGRAAPAAIAAFLSSLAVAVIVSKFSAERVDSDLAAFILAIPGIAAAWLGFDSSASALLSGTLAARTSLAVTFLVSVVGSAALLLQKSAYGSDGNSAETVTTLSYTVDVLEFNASVDVIWLVISAFAFTNMLVMCYYSWERSRYYRTLAVREVDGAAVIHGG